MPKRSFEGSDEDTSYIPDPSLIKSGDTFDILRLDGLDPMIGWAMGSATGDLYLYSPQCKIISFFAILFYIVTLSNSILVYRPSSHCHVVTY